MVVKIGIVSEWLQSLASYFCECVGTMRWVRYKCSFDVESTFSMKLSEYTKLGSLKIFGFPFFDTF